MAHLSISPPKGATTLSPLSAAYERDSKDGLIPVVNFLIGSHYNARIGGETSITSVGDIVSDTAKAISGKIEIAGDANSGEVEKIVTFNPFMYFFPGMKIVGHSEIQDADVGSGPIPVQVLRYEFEDLATGDKLRIELRGGDGNANLKFSEIVDGSETDLVTQQLTVAENEVFWELDFLEDGITKFWFLEPGGTKTRIYRGTLLADIGECKASVRLVLDETVVKTVKSDFFWIFYPSGFVGYDVDLASRLSGKVKIFDDNNDFSDETKWFEVRAGDHKFTGQRIVENGLMRIVFTIAPSIDMYGWDGSAYQLTGKVIPVDTDGNLSTILHDIIFTRFNKSYIKINAKFGIVNHVITMHRGNPYMRILSDSKNFRISTVKARMALSTDVVTDIPDFNQENSDDTNRGNPLDLSPTNNPFVFTNDSNVNTGLLLLDDNWFSWYDLIANDVIGFLGTGARPTSCTVTATSSTQLSSIDWSFADNAIIGIGVLNTTPSVLINNVPTPFIIGNVDTYVKWRANEAVISFDHKMFLRRKR